MGPSQPLRLVARDRARRNPGSRPDYTQIYKVTSWLDATPASTSDAEAVPTEAGDAPRPQRNRATRAFLIVLIAAVAVNFGAVLGLVGSSVLPEALRALGLAGEPVMEAVLRKQATTISQLDATVHVLNAAVAGLSARRDFAGEREEATNRRIAEIDVALGALRTDMDEVRATQHTATAEESWRKPVAELAAAVTRTRSEIIGLRASLDQAGAPGRPEVVAIGARIDRLEQAMIQHSLLGPIRGSIQEQGARPRSLVSRAPSLAASGHIIELTPAR